MSRYREMYRVLYPLTELMSGSTVLKSITTWPKTAPGYGGTYGDRPWSSQITDEISSPGLRPFNACSHLQLYGCQIRGNRQAVYRTGVDTASWSMRRAFVGYQTLGSPPSDSWAPLINELADKLNGRIDEGTLLGVTFAELGKTIRMVRNPFSLLKPDWRKRSESLPGIALAKKAANIWLEHRYGWLSAATDIKHIGKTISEIVKAKTDSMEELSQRLSCSTNGTLDAPSIIYPWGGDEADWNLRLANLTQNSDQLRLTNVKSRWTRTVGCRQLMSVAEQWDRQLQCFNAFGLDARSITATLWELVPFSFVIDWFVDPQSLWSPLSRQRLSRVDVQNLGFSTLQELEYDVEYIPIPNPWCYNAPWSYETPTKVVGDTVFHSTTKGRIRKYVRKTGLPSLEDTLAIFKSKGLSTVQSVSGAALLIQKLLQ